MEIRVDSVFDDIEGSLVGFDGWSIRRPRRWRGEVIDANCFPVAVVSVDCYNNNGVYDVLSNVVGRNHVSWDADRGYCNSRSEYFVYVNLRKNIVV